MRIQIKKVKCKRCGHEWVPRKEEIIICPKCKSPYWNRDKKEKISNKMKSKQEDLK